MTLVRRAAAALLVTALAGAGLAMAAVPAQALSSYRYWSYWNVEPAASSWHYGGTGPAGHRVDDGGVEGWRFVVAAPNPSAPKPRTSAAAAFQAICGGTARPAGKDRVAVVVDYGTATDAPPHESRPGTVVGTCVVVDDRSNGLVALSKAGYAPRMGNGGLVCGVSGYPATECGVVVKATPTPSPSNPEPTKSAAPQTPAPSSSKTATAPSPSRSAGSSAAASRPAPSTDPTPSTTTPAADGTTSDPAESDPALAVGPPPRPPGGTSTGTPVGLVVGALLVLAVGAAAMLRTKGRGPQQQGTT